MIKSNSKTGWSYQGGSLQLFISENHLRGELDFQVTAKHLPATHKAIPKNLFEILWQTSICFIFPNKRSSGSNEKKKNMKRRFLKRWKIKMITHFLLICINPLKWIQTMPGKCFSPLWKHLDLICFSTLLFRFSFNLSPICICDN